MLAVAHRAVLLTSPLVALYSMVRSGPVLRNPSLETSHAQRPRGAGPQGQEVALWSGRGAQFAAALSVGARSPTPQRQSDSDFLRDLGMGKPNAVNVVAPRRESNSRFSNAEVASACDSQIRNMEIGYRGGMDVYQVDVLPPVKPAQSGLPAMVIPQTDLLYPAKIYVLFQNGGGRRYTQVYLYKSPFGTKCMDSP